MLSKKIFLVPDPMTHQIMICDSINRQYNHPVFYEVGENNVIISEMQNVLILDGDADLNDAFVHHKTFDKNGSWYFGDKSIIYHDKWGNAFSCRLNTRMLDTNKKDPRNIRTIHKTMDCYEIGIERTGRECNMIRGKVSNSMAYQIHSLMPSDRATCSLEIFQVMYPVISSFEERRKTMNILTRRLKDLEDAGYIKFIGKEYFDGTKVKMYKKVEMN